MGQYAGIWDGSIPSVLDVLREVRRGLLGARDASTEHVFVVRQVECRSNRSVKVFLARGREAVDSDPQVGTGEPEPGGERMC